MDTIGRFTRIQEKEKARKAKGRAKALNRQKKRITTTKNEKKNIGSRGGGGVYSYRGSFR